MWFVTARKRLPPPFALDLSEQVAHQFHGDSAMTDQGHAARNFWPRLSLRLFFLLVNLATVVLATIGLKIKALYPVSVVIPDPDAPFARGDYTTWESDPEIMWSIYWDRVVSSPTILILVAVLLVLIVVLFFHAALSILVARKT
jgi:hypothetical protein